MAKLTTTQKMVLAALGIAALAAALIYWLVAPLAEEDGIRVKSGARAAAGSPVEVETICNTGFESKADKEDAGKVRFRTKGDVASGYLKVTVDGDTCESGVNSVENADSVTFLVKAPDGVVHRTDVRRRNKKLKLHSGGWELKNGDQPLTRAGDVTEVEALDEQGARLISCKGAIKNVEIRSTAATKCAPES